ncbi:MAG: PstS family phosphate ABC transporter substrate-binding protein [Alphaproteobacteria bacterium]|nr:PstS family phosphate ABC transporter substrate-binding protein [Alphaproteobacteria bacterium]
MSIRTLTLATLATIALTGAAAARDQIRIVGSSTVFPFSTAVAEAFGKAGKFKTPVVEATGSGGGIKLFCAGVGVEHPDITNSSRRIKAIEVEDCKKNGADITEVKVGFDGIVLANAKTAQPMKLTLAQVFLALAKRVPVDGKLAANPYKKWGDVDPSLPNRKIEVLGPPPTSGTRDAFAEIAMEGGCGKAVGAKEADLTGSKCHAIREDGAYIEAGENDNLIVQKLIANPGAVGVFGFSFLYQNADKLQGATVDGTAPTFEAIADGKYPLSRSLYFYVKKQHVGVIPGLHGFIAEFTNDRAWGPDGYLAAKGLIPLPNKERGEVAGQANNLAPLRM